MKRNYRVGQSKSGSVVSGSAFEAIMLFKFEMIPTVIIFSVLFISEISGSVISQDAVKTNVSDATVDWESENVFLQDKFHFDDATDWTRPITSQANKAGIRCSKGKDIFLGGSTKRPAITPFSQGRLGSCTANAMAMALKIAYKKTGSHEVLNVSRLWLYYIGRLKCLTYTTEKCRGAFPAAMYKNLKNIGFLKENQWPYRGDLNELDPYVNVPPTQGWESLVLAKQNLDKYFGKNGIVLFKLSQIGQIQKMVDDGIPVIFAYNVWRRIHRYSGNIDFSTVSGKPIGGHAALIVGYSNPTCQSQKVPVFHFLSSWGTDFGDNGVGTIPQSYFSNSTLNNIGANVAYAIRFTDGNKVI